MSETTLTAPDWVTAIGLIASAAVAIIGYLLDSHKARHQRELQAQLERDAQAETARLERVSREEAAHGQLRHMCDQAELKRVRQQMSVFIGPLHRHIKLCTTAILNFFVVRGHYPGVYSHYGDLFQAKPLYGACFPPGLCEKMAADPQGECACEWRAMCREILVPGYNVCRQLILEYGSDLADTPSKDAWEDKYTKEQLESPGTKATTHFSAMDAFCLWSKEFELLVRDWDEERGVFPLWQPRALFPVMLNGLVDTMFSQVKKRESKFVASVEEYRGSTTGGLDISKLPGSTELDATSGQPVVQNRRNQVAPVPAA